MVRLDDVDDRLHERGRREELAVVLRALHRELRQEVFVDAAEHVARCAAQRLAVEGSQQVFEQAGVELLVVLGQLVQQRLEVGLDGLHRRHQRRAQVAAFGQRQQVVVVRLGWQHQRAAAARSRPATSLRLGILPASWSAWIGLQCSVVAVAGVAQEDHARARACSIRCWSAWSWRATGRRPPTGWLRSCRCGRGRWRSSLNFLCGFAG